MDLITTGVSSSERMRRENLVSATRSLLMEKLTIGGSSARLMEVCDINNTPISELLSILSKIDI